VVLLYLSGGDYMHMQMHVYMYVYSMYAYMKLNIYIISVIREAIGYHVYIHIILCNDTCTIIYIPNNENGFVLKQMLMIKTRLKTEMNITPTNHGDSMWQQHNNPGFLLDKTIGIKTWIILKSYYFKKYSSQTSQIFQVPWIQNIKHWRHR